MLGYRLKDGRYEVIPEEAERVRRAARFKKKPAHRKTYPFTGLLVCENCGKNYRRKVTATGVVWICGTYNSSGKVACSSKQIPEETLQRVTAEALGQAEFSEELLRRQIKNILVCKGNVLVFRFFDGSEVTKVWQDRSRAESWTEEMKEIARQRALGTDTRFQRGQPTQNQDNSSERVSLQAQPGLERSKEDA